jgi:hypothetical protein
MIFSYWLRLNNIYCIVVVLQELHSLFTVLLLFKKPLVDATAIYYFPMTIDQSSLLKTLGVDEVILGGKQ